MSFSKRGNADSLLMLLSVLYVTLPIGIFFIGWLNIPAVVLSVAVLT